ncbi:MAG: hypothetical protein V3V00_13295 [Saprospiraceae bacterium]
MNTIFQTIILAICMASAITAFGANDYKKTITESYDISNGAKVELINKYGNIDIRTIDSDEVNIRVEIVVDAKNEDRAQKIFDRIDIDFYHTVSSIKAETKIGDTKKRWNNIFSWKSDCNFEIHYYIEAPSHVHLKLYNKYGNIYIPDMDNDVDIVLKYGNFKMGNAHDIDINLGYGNGEMANIQNLDLDVKYSKIVVESAKDVDVKSKYSTIIIDIAKNIDADSKYDKFRIKEASNFENSGKYDDLKLGTINDIKIYSKFTHIDIETLITRAKIKTDYGSIRIDAINAELEQIDIVSSYASIRIYNPDKVAYRYDIETKYGSIKIDEGTGDFGDDDNEEWARGKRKGKGSGNGLIRIESRYGNVKIR